jgi:hypothetical protein
MNAISFPLVKPFHPSKIQRFFNMSVLQTKSSTFSKYLASSRVTDCLLLRYALRVANGIERNEQFKKKYKMLKVVYN